MQKTLYVVVGPTASGKTDFAISLAQKLGTQIISADARQIYRELEIGTGKPTPAQLASVPHYFINSHSIHEDFDAGQFEKQALELLDDLFTKVEAVVMAGGSGLFVQAVCEGFDDIVTVPDSVRAQVIADYHDKGLEFLQNELQNLDPVYFEQIDSQNPMRVMRAIEVMRTSGLPFSAFRRKNLKTRPFRIIKIGMACQREQLYAKINSRVDEMVAAGLEAEARKLWPHKGLISLKTVGYSEFFDYFEGKTDLSTCIELIKRNTRRYAKRQLTWFRRDIQTIWLMPEEREEFIKNLKITHKKII